MYIDNYTPIKKFIPDPRGNFIISLDRENKNLTLSHYSPDQKKMREFCGKSAIELYQKILLHDSISTPTHIADISCEMQKAEIALKEGIVYIQDQPLDFSKKI